MAMNNEIFENRLINEGAYNGILFIGTFLPFSVKVDETVVNAGEQLIFLKSP